MGTVAERICHRLTLRRRMGRLRLDTRRLQGSARGDRRTRPAYGGVSPFNFVTLTAFLAWFGGTGYLLTRYSGLWVGFGLLASVTSGLVGGGIVFLFLSKVLISDDENMDPADYEMVGVLGRVSSSIREGGTGEMIYTQMGTRRVCGARSDDGSAIAKGTEVVVTRYEKGIAYVRLWSEMSGESERTVAKPLLILRTLRRGWKPRPFKT